VPAPPSSRQEAAEQEERPLEAFFGKGGTAGAAGGGSPAAARLLGSHWATTSPGTGGLPRGQRGKGQECQLSCWPATMRFEDLGQAAAGCGVHGMAANGCWLSGFGPAAAGLLTGLSVSPCNQRTAAGAPAPPAPPVGAAGPSPLRSSSVGSPGLGSAGKPRPSSAAKREAAEKRLLKEHGWCAVYDAGVCAALQVPHPICTPLPSPKGGGVLSRCWSSRQSCLQVSLSPAATA
jgi:hypothetical protein